jgi:hypothetical protein
VWDWSVTERSATLAPPQKLPQQLLKDGKVTRGKERPKADADSMDWIPDDSAVEMDSVGALQDAHGNAWDDDMLHTFLDWSGTSWDKPVPVVPHLSHEGLEDHLEDHESILIEHLLHIEG